MTGNAIHAQGFMKKLLKKEDSKEEVALDTITINLEKGVTFYPCSIENEKWNASNRLNISGKPEKEIFINTLFYAIDKAERGRSHIVALDVEKKQFSVVLEFPSQFYSENSTYYKYANTFRVMGENLSFLSSEMHVGYRNLMGDVKEMPFEKLDTNKKAKHKNYVNELAAINSNYLHDLILFIKNNEHETISHWNEIANGKVVKGMNETECLLSIGKPMHKRQNGNQTKWMVNNDFVIIFDNGIVTDIIL